MPKKLPIGIDNFEKLIESDYWFADKSLMIKDFIDGGAEVTLITRPRRWGKTLNMSMLYHFFSSQTTGENANNLFKNLQIAQVDNGRYLQHQAQYPVIFISFKDVKEDTYEKAIENIKIIVRNAFLDHYDVLSESKRLNQIEKEELNNITKLQAKEQELEFSLQTLTRLLHKHYKKTAIILIDEYDTPLNAAYGKYLDQLVRFMRNFLSAGLKSNKYLHKALMTGILRISQTSILSGLNNPDVFTLFNKQYNQYFGFTEAEVKDLLQHLSSSSEIKITLQDIKDWYNGYKISDLLLYNPWSIVKCLSRSELQAHWVRTADDSLLEDIVANSSEEARGKFTQLLQNKPIEGNVSEHIAFNNLKQNETALWSLLVFAGYLQAESFEQTGIDYKCQLKIPNYEVSLLYDSIFRNWLEEKKFNYDSFIKQLLSGDCEKFTNDLGKYLMGMVGMKDVTKETRESFYHGFMLSLVLGLRDTHDITSNRESGYGFYDIMIIPKASCGEMAIILEFKHAKENEDMGIVAKSGLEQIELKQYEANLTLQTHVKSVLKIGLAFCDKAVRSAFKLKDLTKREESALTYSSEILFDEDIHTTEESEEAKPRKRVIRESDEGEEQPLTKKSKTSGFTLSPDSPLISSSTIPTHETMEEGMTSPSLRKSPASDKED